jgi:hypothetical protein
LPREKQYDLREIVPVFTPEGGDAHPRLTALVYIATADRAANPNYLGPAPVEEVAAQIARCSGPSGPNSDYLFRLAKAMRGMGVEDEELFLLEVGRCRRAQRAGQGAARVQAGQAAGTALERFGAALSPSARAEGAACCSQAKVKEIMQLEGGGGGADDAPASLEQTAANGGATQGRAQAAAVPGADAAEPS